MEFTLEYNKVQNNFVLMIFRLSFCSLNAFAERFGMDDFDMKHESH